MPRSASAVVLIIGVLALTALTFLPVRTFDFVDWDDPVYAGGTRAGREGEAPGLAGTLTEYVSGNYHPLTMLSHAADRRVFGQRPQPPHIVNLVLHLCNAALVLLVLRGLGTPLGGAAAGSLLWAVHPLRIEAVAWVSGRKDLLAAFFALAAILAYLAFRREGRKSWLASSVAFFVLSLLSKATVASLPLILIAVDWLQRRPLAGRALREKLPYLLAAAMFAAVALAARSSFQGVLEERSYGWEDSVFLGTFRAVFYFLFRAVLPLTNPGWLYPEAPRPHLLSGPFAAAVLSILLLLGLGALSLRWSRKVVFGLVFFFLALSPVLAVHVLGFSADRFTYLPSVGLAYLCGELTARLQGTPGARPAARNAAVAAAVGGITVFLALQTRGRLGAWESSEALWTEAVRQYVANGVGGRNLSLAYAYRARARLGSGNGVGALADYALAVGLEPGDPELRNERGAALAANGAHREAVEEFTAALEREPGSSAAAFNRGLAWLALRDGAAAEADFSRALAADGGDEAALLGRARARMLLRAWDAALRDVEQVLAHTPYSPEAIEIRGEIIVAQRRAH